MTLRTNDAELDDAPVHVLRRMKVGELLIARTSRLESVKARKVDATRTLIVDLHWERGTTPFQRNMWEAILGKLLERWLWDGWSHRFVSHL